MRSKFEEKIAAQLEAADKGWVYEHYKFDYYKRVRSGSCKQCTSKDVVQKHIYTPDFFVIEKGFFIETKGIFSPTDRQKMILMKEQHPGIEIRLVFQQDALIQHKKKSTRYTAWAADHDYMSAVGGIPVLWLV
jgi:hypothetical protein